MKKIIILFFLICAIPLSACSKAPEQIPAPTVQRLTSPLELSEDEAATLYTVLRGKQCPVGCRASQHGSDRPPL